MVKETRSRAEGPPFPKPREMFAGDVLPLPRRKSTQTSRLRNAEAYRRRKASSSKNKATTTSGESQKAKESSADGTKQAHKLQQEETSGAPPPEGELPDCKLQSGDDATQADGWTASTGDGKRARAARGEGAAAGGDAVKAAQRSAAVALTATDTK